MESHPADYSGGRLWPSLVCLLGKNITLISLVDQLSQILRWLSMARC